MAAPGFGEVAESLRRSTVQVQNRRARSGGSGVIWSGDGLIVTNAHVVHEAPVRVTLWDGSNYGAELLKRDVRRDLATLRIPAAGLPAAVAGDSSTLRPGELVIAIGNPMGFIGALSAGVVHTNRKRWVAADVRLAPGNSGGPLADARGHVIGINTMIAGGLALAVPSNAVADFVSGRAASGPTLGVTLQPVSLRGGALGFLLLEIEPGSAADSASLKRGDLLVGAAGKPFGSLDDLSEALDSAGVLELQFLRGDRRHSRTTSVRLQTRAPEAA